MTARRPVLIVIDGERGSEERVEKHRTWGDHCPLELCLLGARCDCLDIPGARAAPTARRAHKRITVGQIAEFLLTAIGVAVAGFVIGWFLPQ
jgi:hypothetical protein